MSATFRATMFRYDGPGGWTFVEVPAEQRPLVVGAWGRTPVRATVDGVCWDTSVWTERSGRVLLAIPKQVRRAKQHGDEVEVSLAPRAAP